MIGSSKNQFVEAHEAGFLRHLMRDVESINSCHVVKKYWSLPVLFSCLTPSLSATFPLATSNNFAVFAPDVEAATVTGL